jgi:hypothetical protein
MGCNHSYVPSGSTTFRGQAHHVYRCEYCKNTLMTPQTAAGRQKVGAVHAKADRKDANAAARRKKKGCLPVLVAVFVLFAVGLFAVFG